MALQMRHHFMLHLISFSVKQSQRFFNYSTPPNQSKETKPRRLHFYLNLPYWDKTHKNLKISLQNEITKYNNEKNIQSHLNNKYIAPLLLESKKAAPFKGAAYE
ncbi:MULTISPECIES: hypothetical protein [unclassified Bartonella]|uniref:hypothetical protein n=1 Tax=unclassified Bartonella TaxID=2645622 RepID=UPI0035CF4C09